MKDRHINIEADTALLKALHKTVQQNLSTNAFATAIHLVLKFAFYFSIAVYAYYHIFVAQNFSSLLLGYIGFGVVTVLLGFNFAHDLSHNTIFKQKALNNFYYTLLYTLLGADAEAWKYRHIHAHHYAPNVKDYDSDLQITQLIRVEPGSALKWFHRYQHWYAPFAYTTYSLYWVFIKDFVLYCKDHTNPQKKTMGYHVVFWMQKTIYLLLLLILPCYFSLLQWQQVVLAFVLMHLTQSLFLLFTFFITHHVEKTAYFNADANGYIKTSWVMNQVKSSNDFYPFSYMANFIFGGFNNHIAHHLFPHINHLHYPKINTIIYPLLKAHHIEPNVTGYFSGIISHLRYLKRMGRKKCNNKCSKCRLVNKHAMQAFAASLHTK